MPDTRASVTPASFAGAGLDVDPESLGLRRSVVALDSGDVVVHSGRQAGGRAAILLHGAAGSWTTWIPLLHESDWSGLPLTDVIAIDLPGWGESALPDAADFDVRAMSAAVATVARRLGYEEWTVAGHSLGGFVALDLAVLAPESTHAVGLVSPTGPAVLAAIERPVKGGAALPWFAGMLVAMRTLALLPDEGRRLIAALRRIGVFGALSAPLFKSRRALHPSVVDVLAAEIRPRAFLRAARAAAAYDVTRWRAIRCPVRSIRGGRDVFVGSGDCAAFDALIADYAEARLPAVGHFAAIERPSSVLAALGDVLRSGREAHLRDSDREIAPGVRVAHTRSR